MQRCISTAWTRIIKYPESRRIEERAIGKFALAIQLILLNSSTMEAKNALGGREKSFYAADCWWNTNFTLHRQYKFLDRHVNSGSAELFFKHPRKLVSCEVRVNRESTAKVEKHEKDAGKIEIIWKRCCWHHWRKRLLVHWSRGVGVEAKSF